MSVLNKILFGGIVLVILAIPSFAYVNRETATDIIEYVEGNAREDGDVAISVYQNINGPERYFAPTHKNTWVEIDSKGRVVENGRTFQSSDQIVDFIQEEGYSWEVGEMQARDFSNLDIQTLYGKAPVATTVSAPVMACFLGMMEISLADGLTKQIRFVQSGEKVLSFDPVHKMPVISNILHVYSHKDYDYLVVNDHIKVTPYHYVYARKMR